MEYAIGIVIGLIIGSIAGLLVMRKHYQRVMETEAAVVAAVSAAKGKKAPVTK